LKAKATAATHAETRLSFRVPRNITHGEPMTKSNDVDTLRIASGASYPVWRLPGMTALSAIKKASKPLIVGPSLPPLTAGRNQAEALRSQASAIRRLDLLIYALPATPRIACATSICKREEWLVAKSRKHSRTAIP
jgi:hypothetical protein